MTTSESTPDTTLEFTQGFAEQRKETRDGYAGGESGGLDKLATLLADS